MVGKFRSIHVDKKAEYGFRRRALKAMPYEYVEALWGYIQGDVVHICKFVPIKHRSGLTWLEYQNEEVEQQKIAAREVGLQVLGSIHTHPDRNETIFSEHDLRDIQENPEPIMAICAIEVRPGRRSVLRISYWPGVHPISVYYTGV